MKKIILIGCALLGVIVPCASPSSSSSPSIIHSLDAEEEIELKGSLSEISTRSVIRQIRAFKSASGLEVDFLYDLGDIGVVVYDETGKVVYRENVDTCTERQLSIDISTWKEGNYTIRFINTDGRFMYGEFEID